MSEFLKISKDGLKQLKLLLADTYALSGQTEEAANLLTQVRGRVVESTEVDLEVKSWNPSLTNQQRSLAQKQLDVYRLQKGIDIV